MSTTYGHYSLHKATTTLHVRCLECWLK